MSGDRLDRFREEHSAWTVRRDAGPDWLVYTAQRVQVIVAGSLDELGVKLGEIAGVPADDPRVARARELAAERHQPLTMTPGDLRVLVGCWQRAATGLLDLLTETAETTSRS